MRRISLAIATAVLLTVSWLSPAQATLILNLVPSAGKIKAGQQVDVDVRISGLGNGAAPSLAAFDLRFLFNPVVLDFTGLSFGNQLDLFGFGFNPRGVAQDPNPAIGAVDFFEISLDTAFDLDTFQADSFSLATLSFTGLTAGVSSLNLATPLLSDSLGNILAASVAPGLVKVPEPAAYGLFIVGLVGLGLLVRRRRMRMA